MSWGDLTNTLARIEAAASRMEDAARQARTTSNTSSNALLASHERLRSEVGVTLRQLDALIERLDK